MNSGPAGVGRMNAHALLAAGAAAILVAVLAAWLLSPTQGPPEPDRAAAERVLAESFSAEEADRAGEYRSRTRMIGIASLVVQFGLLAFLAFWRGRPMRALLRYLGRRPLPGALATGAGLSFALALGGLPADLAAWQLGRDFGLVHQELAPRLADWLIGMLVGVIPAAIGALLAMALWRRFRERFWIVASVLVGLWAVIVTWLWPVVVSPLFNDFEPLPAGPVREQVLRLSEESGVDVGEVYVVDASRRSSTVNAYVNGIGSSKRVVIYDNAIRSLDRRELEALIAHELGHVKANDLFRGLGFALIVIPPGVLFVQLAARRILRRNGDDPAGPALIPVLAFLVAATVFVLQVPGSALSRQVEAKADRYAVALTEDPRGLVDLQVGLARANLSDVDPPAAWHFLFGSHPTTLQRIAIAEGAR